MGSIGYETQNGVHSGYDVLCTGAGLSGGYTTYRLREIGLRGRIVEQDLEKEAHGIGTDSARFDPKSYPYQFSFDKELMNEWDWRTLLRPPEILAYTQHVVDKFDLRRDMQFDARIQSAKLDEDRRIWVLLDQNGTKSTLRWLITAGGVLTTPTLSNILGVDDYQGAAYHTARWPKPLVSFANERVAVIGTGATRIQTIQEISKTAGHLTVFNKRLIVLVRCIMIISMPKNCRTFDSSTRK